MQSQDFEIENTWHFYAGDASSLLDPHLRRKLSTSAGSGNSFQVSPLSQAWTHLAAAGRTHA